MFNKKKWLCLLLAVMVFSGCLTSAFVADAAVVTKKNKTYDIAVVFDNSGSMYRDQSWCRAKYAMEIFASMLNYGSGDVLKIFTMWEITKDGSEPESGGSFEGFEITSAQDMDQITKLYTVNPSNTPFEPIQEAYEYLQNSTKTDKWLIVLTDGAFNERKRGESDEISLQKELVKLASDEISVQYLGFGAATALKSNADKNFYAKKSSATSLKDDLVAICNSIFQRSVMPKDKLDGNKLTLDISMRNLIVFVQGDNAAINTLHNSNGEEVGILFDSGQRKFSKIKAKGYEDAPVDNTLAGQVVSFAECPKGEYTLDYSGADSIQIFYEPDVDINLEFTDSKGNVIDLNKESITAGEYNLNYGIIDNITGEDAIKSGLLGDEVELHAWVVKGDGEEVEIEENGKVILNPDEKTYFKVEGTYLKDYKITTEDNKEAYTFEVQYPSENELDITAEVTQENNWYKQSEHKSWKPVNVAVKINGKPLTDEEMAKLEWKIKTEDITWHSETVPGESALNIYIGYDENGKFVKPDNGKYKLEIQASAKDEYDRTMKDKGEVQFEIQSYSVIGKWLRWVLPIVAVVLAFLIFMSKKVMPKDIEGQNIVFKVKGRNINPGGRINYRGSDKKLSIKSSSVPTDNRSECVVSLVLRPVDNRWTSSSNRRIEIVDIQGAGMGVKKVSIGAKEYVKTAAGRWHDADNPDAPIKQTIKNAFITIEANKSSFDCQLKHK